ncbi:hypothetical protein KUTeg_017452 [Tegillarca granosa]|uniref:Uncharacterized protein n=1 Tax=Tegillarca granosa TaxID=220873 RepID=A0ABQ9EGQ8_TEGGR|nr:hypothetical protein KUTeg_017452 [Tegillarca granosa]
MTNCNVINNNSLPQHYLFVLINIKINKMGYLLCYLSFISPMYYNYHYHLLIQKKNHISVKYCNNGCIISHHLISNSSINLFCKQYK